MECYHQDNLNKGKIICDIKDNDIIDHQINITNNNNVFDNDYQNNNVKSVHSERKSIISLKTKLSRDKYKREDLENIIKSENTNLLNKFDIYRKSYGDVKTVYSEYLSLNDNTNLIKKKKSNSFFCCFP